MLVKYKFAPGVNKEGTKYTADSGWYDSDKIRFRKGRPEQIGGWQKYSSNTFLGTCRSIHDWKAAAATDYLGLGTTLKYYINSGDAYYDVTPIRQTTAAGDVTFSASNGMRLLLLRILHTERSKETLLHTLALSALAEI